jgi:hypothetical protein
MSSVNAPFGLRPVAHDRGGEVRFTSSKNIIQSGYAANLGKYTPIRIDPATGFIVVADNSNDFLGVFAGCSYRPTGQTLNVTTTQWVSGTTYVAGSMEVYLYQDPDIIYEIQATGSLAQTSIGQQANLVNPGTVNTLGFSTTALSTTLVAASNTDQMRIIDLADIPDNVFGDAFTVVKVKIAQHQYVANKNTLNV